MLILLLGLNLYHQQNIIPLNSFTIPPLEFCLIYRSRKKFLLTIMPSRHRIDEIYQTSTKRRNKDFDENHQILLIPLALYFSLELLVNNSSPLDTSVNLFDAKISTFSFNKTGSRKKY